MQAHNVQLSYMDKDFYYNLAYKIMEILMIHMKQPWLLIRYNQESKPKEDEPKLHPHRKKLPVLRGVGRGA